MRNRMKWILGTIFLVGLTMQVRAQEITVLGSQEETINLLNSDKWWSEKKQGRQLAVPHTIVLAISERWKKNAPKLQVPVKKELFFSSLLPMVLHANQMVLDKRELIQKADAKLAGGGKLSAAEKADLKKLAGLLRISSPEKIDQMNDSAEIRKILKEALYKLDVIPGGLVLGQAAYESG